MNYLISSVSLLKSALGAALATTFLIGGISLLQAQDIEITEIMYNPNDEGEWEWIEIRNTTGADIDMDGWLGFTLDANEVVGPNPTIVSNTNSPNTVLPANGVAVIYDGFHGAGQPGTFDDTLFRQAWNLDSSVPLMAASFFPFLSNTEGSTRQSIGFWANETDYMADLVTGGTGATGNKVGSFTNAQFSISWADAAFPAPTGDSSMTWTGNGSNQSGNNWVNSQVGVNGAYASTLVTTTGNKNSTSDVANPGLTGSTAGASTTTLTFSEIMYNPRSDDSEWEWVEVFNGTAAAVDLSGFVFDDNNDGLVTAPNITSGTVAAGGTAILYNSALDLTDMQTAWGAGLTFIAVDEFPALNQSGDTISLWSSAADYNGETLVDHDNDPGTSDRLTTGSAALTLTYEVGSNGMPSPGGWPDDDGNGSVYLLDYSDPSNGANWELSATFDGIGSFNANPVSNPGGNTFHPGDDIGSPGIFNVVTAVSADVDNSGLVDGADFLAIQRGDFPGVTIADWQAQYGTAGAAVASAGAVPEPTSLLLVGMALTLAGCVRRKA